MDMPAATARFEPSKSLTLADFSAIVGAEPRWCQNALQSLGLAHRYDQGLARELGLAYLIHGRQGVPLRRAHELARDALQQRAVEAVRLPDPEGVSTLVLDVPRYLTLFALRLARLRADTPRRRGRPHDPPAGTGLTEADAYGLDLSALRSGLHRSPAERLRQLDANQRLVAALRLGRAAE